MGMLMIRCPRTNRAISTEIETEESVRKRLPQVACHLRCPACGEVHVWTVKEAWLADAPHMALAGDPGAERNPAVVEAGHRPLDPAAESNEPSV